MVSIPFIRIAWGITHKIYDIMTGIFGVSIYDDIIFMYIL